MLSSVSDAGRKLARFIQDVEKFLPLALQVGCPEYLLQEPGEGPVTEIMQHSRGCCTY
ncbi:unnamed protein product [Larinioides sclopetarius]|uniref:Uncharacterized protein n=1 Tax=Larinioides sclopetarius TaxID=280406 RepID=A0AAV2AUJ9_9ARAC